VLQASLELSLLLAACSPVEDSKTATIAGGAYNTSRFTGANQPH
jgi:hypothetical protein